MLVPGAGLGRLAWEIAHRGYECQGSEFSLYMLFTSNFLLNKCPSVNMFRIHPYIHEFCNNVTSKDQLQEVTFPDVDPSALLGINQSELSIVCDNQSHCRGCQVLHGSW